MSANIQVRAGFDVERSDAPTGSFAALGTGLAYNPVVIIFDNQTDDDVEVSVDGTNTWKTFTAGEALVLDCRANHGIASNFTIDIGTQFYIKGTGSGNFSISVIYAR